MRSWETRAHPGGVCCCRNAAPCADGDARYVLATKGKTSLADQALTKRHLDAVSRCSMTPSLSAEVKEFRARGSRWRCQRRGAMRIAVTPFGRDRNQLFCRTPFGVGAGGRRGAVSYKERAEYCCRHQRGGRFGFVFHGAAVAANGNHPC